MQNITVKRLWVNGEDGEMNRDLAETAAMTVWVCFFCPQRKKMVNNLRAGPKATFRLHQQRGRGRAPLVSVPCHKKIWQVVLKGCWTVGESAVPFLLLVQNSDQELVLFYADLFAPKEPKKKRTKRFELQLKSSETRTFFRLQKLDLGSQIHGWYPIQTGTEPVHLFPHQWVCQSPDEMGGWACGRGAATWLRSPS